MRLCFAVVLAVTFTCLVVGCGNPKKKIKRAAKPVAAQQKPKSDPAFEAGFAAGFLMAKTGSMKPASEQVDAMARRQSFEAGSRGGSAYTHSWKTGFWMGWNQGD